MAMIEDYEENYVTGWIKLYRSLKNKGWYKKSDFVHLWIHLLIKANHKGKEFWFGGKNIKVSAGQFVTGRKILSAETGISESKVQRILKQFESEQQIEQQTNNTNRLISILNWEQYQKVEQQSEQQMNNGRTTSEQRVNTNKNDNNVKNEKNEKNIPAFEDFLNYALEKEPLLKHKAVRLKYDAWAVNGWKDGNDNKINNWKVKLINTIPYIDKEQPRKMVY